MDTLHAVLTLLSLLAVLLECAWTHRVLRPAFAPIPGQVDMNDQLLHRYAVKYAAASSRDVWAPDFWLPGVGLGFPLFSHYQHLPHVLCASLGIGTDALSLGVLTAMPLSIFGGLVVAGFSPVAASASALLYPLLNDRPPPQNRQQGAWYSYGLGWNSYVRPGHGLWSQLLAGLLFVPALGLGFAAMTSSAAARRRRGSDASRSPRIKPLSVVAGAAVAGCLLSNVFYGYMSAATLALVPAIAAPLLLPAGRQSRSSTPSWSDVVHAAGVELVVVGGTAAALSAYFVLPFLLNRGEVSDVEHRAWKFDSVGTAWLHASLRRGDVFDFGFGVDAASTTRRHGSGGGGGGGGGTSSGWPLLTTAAAAGFFCALGCVGASVLTRCRCCSRQKRSTTSSPLATAAGKAARSLGALSMFAAASSLAMLICFAGPQGFAALGISRAVLHSIPFIKSLHLHRFVGGLHGFAFFLFALPLEFAARVAARLTLQQERPHVTKAAPPGVRRRAKAMKAKKSKKQEQEQERHGIGHGASATAGRQGDADARKAAPSGPWVVPIAAVAAVLLATYAALLFSGLRQRERMTARAVDVSTRAFSFASQPNWRRAAALSAAPRGGGGGGASATMMAREHLASEALIAALYPGLDAGGGGGGGNGGGRVMSSTARTRTTQQEAAGAGRIFTGFQGYGWVPRMSIFPRLLLAGADVIGPALHTMSGAGQYVEWLDHDNADHAELFNLRALLLPRHVRPPPHARRVHVPLLVGAPDETTETRRENAEKETEEKEGEEETKTLEDLGFALYSLPTSGYCLPVARCRSFHDSTRAGRCLHPLLHEARYGRGYGKGAGLDAEVEGEGAYDGTPRASDLEVAWPVSRTGTGTGTGTGTARTATREGPQQTRKKYRTLVADWSPMRRPGTSLPLPSPPVPLRLARPLDACTDTEAEAETEAEGGKMDGKMGAQQHEATVSAKAKKSMAGAMVLVRRGGCQFLDKVLRLQRLGAAGVVVVNSGDEDLVIAGGDAERISRVRLPVVALHKTPGDAIIQNLLRARAAEDANGATQDPEQEQEQEHAATASLSRLTRVVPYRPAPALSLDQMSARGPGALPRSRLDKIRAGQILNETVAPNRHGCTAQLQARATALVVKVNYHPYWRCSVREHGDGAAKSQREPIVAETFRVVPGFLAVRLPGTSESASDQESGRQRKDSRVVTVSCEYAPPLWKRLLFLASAMGGLAGVIAFGVVGRKT